MKLGIVEENTFQQLIYLRNGAQRQRFLRVYMSTQNASGRRSNVVFRLRLDFAEAC